MAGSLKVENLSKKYLIGRSGPRLTFREALVDWATSWARVKSDQTLKEFWALRDVTFSVNAGERIGIIGANGAGKSTLLKILSRVTDPSAGRVTISGRVSSLLEVGTGFHPELTGRENIYLNGAILGMTSSEIRRKFDEIVHFAEVEEFLDTPVKRYSSGMYVRLAFAVAAHLDPDILIVDEVLAVGDARFQRKSLGKMEDSAREGRTVIFVSHSMAAVKNLCQSAVVLDKGRATEKLRVDEAISCYLASVEPQHDSRYPLHGKDVDLIAFEVTQHGLPQNEFDAAFPIDIEIRFRLLRDVTLFRVGIIVRSRFGEIIFRSLLADWDPSFEHLLAGVYKLTGAIPARTLVAGAYQIQVDCSRFGLIDYGFWEPSAKSLKIRSPAGYNTAHPDEQPFGIVYVDGRWNLLALPMCDARAVASVNASGQKNSRED